MEVLDTGFGSDIQKRILVLLFYYHLQFSFGHEFCFLNGLDTVLCFFFNSPDALSLLSEPTHCKNLFLHTCSYCVLWVILFTMA